MKVTGLVLAGCVATAQAGFVRKLFSRDELDQLVNIAARANEDVYLSRIQNWNKPFPVGISPELQKFLAARGCMAPAPGSKMARRSLEADVSFEEILAARGEQPVQKSEAWEAAKNPSTLPPNIKAAFRAAGWTGTCTDGAPAGGKKARSLDEYLDGFELDARDYDDDFFWSE